MKNKQIKILKVWIAVLTLLFTVNSLGAYQAFQPSGSGTKESPYLVESLENLLWMAQHISEIPLGTYFLQTADINASETKDWRDGEGFLPIGWHDFGTFDEEQIQYFSGTFDGNGYVISGLHFIPNLYGDGTVSGSGIALFGAVTNSTLKNIVLENVTFGQCYNGGALVGVAVDSIVSNCHAEVNFIQEEQSTNIGGLIGAIIESAEIVDCSAKVKNLYGSYAGGLIGEFLTKQDNSNLPFVSIKRCRTEGDIRGDMHVGGIVGSGGSPSLMSDCYSHTNVKGNMFYIGGLMGYGKGFKNCYVYGKVENGYAITDNNAKCDGVYYCSEFAKDTKNTSAIGKTSSQLLKRETYQGWDFENVWFMEEDVLLPSLIWEVPEPLIGGLFLCFLCFLLALKIR